MKEFNSFNDILDFAINAEQDAVDFYNMLATNSKNPEMISIFEQFAREEMGHKARITRIREEGSFMAIGDKVPDMKIADYLVKVQPTPDMSYSDALVLAMNREKAAFKLYTRLAERAPGPELKNLFSHLAQEESKHKLRFEMEYDEFVLREN
ncbi:MAG: ferritin family protein [Bacteroidota bacterium]